jgi:hypothetical protein
LQINALMMSREDQDFDGTAAHGPAPLSVEEQWRRILLPLGFKQDSLEQISEDIIVHLPCRRCHIGSS